jgi:hypothetical protein
LYTLVNSQAMTYCERADGHRYEHDGRDVLDVR